MGIGRCRRQEPAAAVELELAEGWPQFRGTMPDTASANNVVVACPHCHTLVRVPDGAARRQPHLRQAASQAVVTGQPVKLDTAAFQTHTGRSDLPVLVDFWAEWCGPCRAMSPVLDRFAAERRTQLQVGKVNTDENQQLAGQLGIRSIPTLILFKGGREIARRVGRSPISARSAAGSIEIAGSIAHRAPARWPSIAGTTSRAAPARQVRRHGAPARVRSGETHSPTAVASSFHGAGRIRSTACNLQQSGHAGRTADQVHAFVPSAAAAKSARVLHRCPSLQLQSGCG